MVYVPLVEIFVEVKDALTIALGEDSGYIIPGKVWPRL
jgi:hypothetical protein